MEGEHSAEQAYDFLSPTYDIAYLSSKDIAENRWLARYLDRHMYLDLSVLDVGCGTGLLLDLCPIQPEWYLGVDVSNKMLTVAREKHRRYSFAKASMDDMSAVTDRRWQSAIYLFGSFSYALDPIAAVTEMARVLMPGGRFFVMLLSHRYPDRASYSVANAGFDVPIITYDAEQARRLFGTSTDLRVTSVRGLSVEVDRLQWMSPKIVEYYYRLEAATLGRLAPSKAAYILVEGRRI